MKKLLMLLVLVPLMTLANTEVVDGITWTYWHYIHYSADADPKLETEILGANPFGKNGDIDKVKQMLVNSGFDVAGVTFTVDWEKDDEPQTIVAETETHVDVAKGEVAPFETVATGVLIDSTGYGTATIKKVGTVSVKVAEL